MDFDILLTLTSKYLEMSNSFTPKLLEFSASLGLELSREYISILNGLMAFIPLIPIHLLTTRAQRFLFNIETRIPGVGLRELVSEIESGKRKGEIFMGVSEEEGGFVWSSLVTKSGFCTVGVQGSGKTNTLANQLGISQLCYGDQLFQVIVDISSKGFPNGSFLFDLDNTVQAFRDVKKTIPLIYMIYDELRRRGEVYSALSEIKRLHWSDVPKEIASLSIESFVQFNKVFPHYIDYFNSIVEKYNTGELSREHAKVLELSASCNLPNFKDPHRISTLESMGRAEKISEEKRKSLVIDRKTSGLSLIMFCFDEFSDYLTSDEINYFDNSHIKGTPAFCLSEIARTGRAYGIGYYIATQSASRAIITREFKDSIGNYVAHKTIDSEASSGIELPQSADLPALVGRGIYPTKSGKPAQVQNPYFTPGTMEHLLNKYKKPFNGELFVYDIDQYEDVTKGDGFSGFIESYPDLSRVIASHDSYDYQGKLKLTQRILELFGFEFEMDIKEEFEINAFAKKDGKKYGVIVNYKIGRMGDMSVSDKSFDLIKKESELIKVDGYIGIDLTESSGYHGSALKSFIESNGGFYCDLKDLQKTAKVFKNQTSDHFETQKEALALSRSINADASVADFKDQVRPRGLNPFQVEEVSIDDESAFIDNGVDDEERSRIDHDLKEDELHEKEQESENDNEIEEDLTQDFSSEIINSDIDIGDSDKPQLEDLDLDELFEKIDELE